MVAMLLKTLKNLQILQIQYAVELALHIHLFHICKFKQQIKNIFKMLYWCQHVLCSKTYDNCVYTEHIQAFFVIIS